MTAGALRGLFCILGLALSGAADAADRLPNAMFGKWTTDLAACSEQSSEIVVTVEARSVLFYEHGYEIRQVTRLKDGTLKASGFSVDLDGRTRGSIQLKLLPDDRLRIGSEIYQRCKRKDGQAQ
jgi:hypothetical protein